MLDNPQNKIMHGQTIGIDMWRIAETTTNRMGSEAPQKTELLGVWDVPGNVVSLVGSGGIVLDPVVLRLDGCPCAFTNSEQQNSQ